MRIGTLHMFRQGINAILDQSLRILRWGRWGMLCSASGN
jgi:hypothetical protein